MEIQLDYSRLGNITRLRQHTKEQISETLVFAKVVVVRKGEKIVHLGDVRPDFYTMVNDSLQDTTPD